MKHRRLKKSVKRVLKIAMIFMVSVLMIFGNCFMTTDAENSTGGGDTTVSASDPAELAVTETPESTPENTVDSEQTAATETSVHSASPVASAPAEESQQSPAATEESKEHETASESTPTPPVTPSVEATVQPSSEPEKVEETTVPERTREASEAKPAPEQAEEPMNEEEPKTEATSFTAYVTSGKNRTDLTEDGTDSEISVGWADGINLHIDATFGEGTNKEIDISLPDGMTFYRDTNYYYKTSDLSGYVKAVVTPPEQSDPNKKNHIILDQNQYNGTMSLQFYSEGDANNVSAVSFDVPIGTAYWCERNSQVWDSGTAWFYDYINEAVVVSQSVNNQKQCEKKLSKLNITNNEAKRYLNGWTSKYNPEVLAGESNTGTDILGVYPLPGGDSYTRQTAYQYYTVTILAPEHAVFEKFSGKKGNGNISSGSYNGATVEISNPGDTVTSLNDPIPKGYRAYTWKIENAIVAPVQLRVCPVFNFPAQYFGDGEGKIKQATISIAYVHARYYGRNYNDGEEENFDSSKFPKLTYDINNKYEEVFAGTYEDKVDKNNNRIHQSDFYEADYNLYLGAPGFEHTQERDEGYFIIGNRGLKNSVPKTITYEFDKNNTGAIGVTQAAIPSMSAKTYRVTNVWYKTWDSTKGIPDDSNVSNWQKYDKNDSTINLKDLGIIGNSGTYIKAIKFDIDTIPKQGYLKSGAPTGDSTYHFYGNVLTDDVHVNDKSPNASDIESLMTIANADGNDSQNGDTSTKNVYGKAFDGTTGKKLVYGCSHDYRDFSPLQVGKGSKEVLSYIHHYSVGNAQLIDKIYLISPFGEDFTNIKMHYGPDWDKASINKKRYLGSEDSPQPEITEVTNDKISDQLRDKYPKAKYYILDFTEITSDQEKYDARQIGDSVLSQKSYENTQFSTFTPNYAGLGMGVWITYDFSPDISDPTGKFSDVTWVEYNTGDDVDKIAYNDNEWWNVNGTTDRFHLTSNPGKIHLGQMNGFILNPTEGLVVDSAAKQSDEVDDSHWWRSYDGKEPYAGNKSVLEMYKDLDYRLTVQNVSSLAVSGVKAYFPVPKKGENWGETMSPKGAFKFSLNLKSGGINIPAGYKVSYCQNATPTNKYEDWDAYAWTDQENTSTWTQSDWNRVNFVKIEWAGTGEKQTIEYGDGGKFTFPMTIDSATSTADDIGKVDMWQPYFARIYKAGTTWLAGSPVAVMPVAGYMEGTVWDDGNQNGIIDNKEKPVRNVHVQLYDVSDPENPVLRVDNVYTDADGHYRFNGLLDGTIAKDLNNYCKIVVTNPSEDPDADNAVYEGFSPYQEIVKGKMSMKEAEDHRTASVTGQPGTKEGESVYDCGLVRNGGNLNVRLLVRPNDLIDPDREYPVQIKVGDLNDTYVASNTEGSVTLSEGITEEKFKDQQDLSVFNLPANEPYVVEAKVDTSEFDVSYTVSSTSSSSAKRSSVRKAKANAASSTNGTIIKRKTQNVVITLTPKTVNAKLFKIDADNPDKYLNGAQFTLQKDGKKVTSTSILPDGQDGLIKIRTSGNELMNLVNGTYTLTETEAPKGYNRLEKGVTFTVNNREIKSDDKNLTISKENDSYVLKVKNTAGKSLPDTGGTGTKIFYIIGGAVILLAIGLIIRRKKND